jgi:hypothetical protein
MTKDEALKLALKALEVAQDNLRPHGDNCFLHDEGEYKRCFCGKDSLSDYLQDAVEKLDTAIKQARSAPVQEPVGFFDWYDNAHWGNEDFKEGCHRSWNAAIKYTTTPAQSAPVQEPVGWTTPHGGFFSNDYITDFALPHEKETHNIPVYITPPAAQRQWVGLTDEERQECAQSPFTAENYRAIEAKLKEKNT